MDCNKEEATRAKEWAEKMFAENNLAGAKIIATRAKSLFPELEGISELLATLDVFIASIEKINNENDWYNVLGVHFSETDVEIKKQYSKLALLLHPEKNKSIGAEGAFKLISEAWKCLSDKQTRADYDQRRVLHDFTGSVLAEGGVTTPEADLVSEMGKWRGFMKSADGFGYSPPETAKPSVFMGREPAPSFAKPEIPDTYWTMCEKCKMHYEYDVFYCNRTIFCLNCNGPFLASETYPPASSVGNDGVGYLHH